MGPSLPILMIGPGTGIAPMRAFLQERQAQIQRLGREAVGEAYLYFGCRNKTADYLYDGELEAYENDGTLTKLYCAFSRDQAHKVYVQHLLKENKTEVFDKVLDKGGHVYVCGATSMGHDVHSTLKDIVKDSVSASAGMEEEVATNYVKELQSSKRYIQELWSASA